MTPEQEQEIARCIFREANDAFFILYPATLRVLDANPAAQRITGHRKKQLLTMTLTDLVQCQTPEQLAALLHACQSTAFFVSADGFSLKTDKRGLIPVNVSVSRIHAEPEPLGLLVVRDISKQKQAEEERRRLEQQLQHAQKLESLGVLTGGIAHDFNNLLTVIMGHVDLAVMEAPERLPVAGRLEQVQFAAQRAADLTRQMLVYSGRAKPQVQPVCLAHLVEEISQLLQVSIPKHVNFKRQFEPRCPWCEGEPGQLTQVIMNAVINAAEAIGERHGQIELSVHRQTCDRALLSRCYIDEKLPEGEYVCLEVRDNGCGMDLATQARIFEPFFTTKFAGRGLGLSAVLGIVVGHRGAVHVESEPGKGTRFRVFLPALPESAVPPTVEPGREIPWSGSGQILVVDDEAPVRGSAKAMLERFGFQVLEAADGVEGLALYREKAASIRAILLDFAMPNMDGGELVRELKHLGITIPVILSSGFDESVVGSAFEPGDLAACVQKPYRFQQLREVLQRVLEPSAGAS
jgi:PAS domain S-box-containing protein